MFDKPEDALAARNQKALDLGVGLYTMPSDWTPGVGTQVCNSDIGACVSRVECSSEWLV